MYVDAWSPSQYTFTLDVLKVPQGSGSCSGFVWDKDDHVVTNYHVIRGASDLSNSIKIYRRNAKRTREHSTDKHCSLRLAQFTGSQNLQNFIVKGQ
ncbi:myb-related protein 306 isoform X1 [Iris pallida]|uniref:Myb-related protein 306 isoform X1 n=1 Tax=Iris pallida TaxID=29817 RepID=A0AAX6G202_IRIPA|nr:myb-related protein 306 isoform X1 [Iris pallida]